MVAPLAAVPQRTRPPRHLADLTSPQRRDVVIELGEKPFRARQLSVHYFARLVDDPAAMTDLPAGSRDWLPQALLPRLLVPLRRLGCDGGTTVKSVWRLFDGALVESVLMRYPDRVTVCVSSQAGCGMGCPFCATGQAGLIRNLSCAEIVDQVVVEGRRLRYGRMVSCPEGPSDGGTPGGVALGDITGLAGRVSNVVFMGMGEPLANYAAVVSAVRRLIDPPPDGLGLSVRGITISTVGLVPAIDRLAGEGLAVTLALSLHAPDDGLRDELVPVNTRWRVGQVLDAARRYVDSTGRRVSVEYALIRDVNDQAWRADLLGRLLRTRGTGWAHVNLIPLNPTPGSRWAASDRAVTRGFVGRLRARGVPATVRDTRGRQVDGACGQLAAATSTEATPYGSYSKSHQVYTRHC